MSGLQKQIIPVPLAQGVDTKDDPKQVPIGKLLTLENGFFQTPGEIRKRYGFTAEPTAIWDTSSTLGTSYGIAAYQNTLVSFNSNRLMAQSGTRWTDVGTMVPAKFTTFPISVKTPSAITLPDESYQDFAYDSVTGLQCYIYGTDTGATNTRSITAIVIDGTTDQSIVTHAVGTVIGGAKVILFNNSFFFIYCDSASGAMKYRRVATATPATISAAVTVSTNLNATNPNFDATVNSTRLFIGFNYVTTGIAIVYLDTAFTISAERVDSAHAGTGVVSVWAGGTSAHDIWAAYSDNSDAYAIVYSFSLAATPVLAETKISTTDNINQITGLADGTNVSQILFCAYTLHSINNLVSSISLTIAGSGSAAVWNRSVSLASKLFLYNSANFVLCQYSGTVTTQPTLFLFLAQSSRTSGGQVVGKLAGGVAYESTRATLLPEVSTSGASTFLIPFSQNSGGQEFPVFGSSWLAQLDMDVIPQSVQIANILHTTGAQLWAFDGANVVEHSFHLYPEMISAVESGSAGPFPAATTYQYIALYEWVDSQGQLNRSSPSLPISITTDGGGSATITVTVSTLRVTQKSASTGSVYVTLFRTAGNGTIFYYLGTATGIVKNNTAADTIGFTDSTADAGIVGNEQLYTTGGQVENSSAPPCQALATYKDRLIVIPSDNPYSWWFSQEVLPNSAASSATPVELSAFLINNVDQKSGPLTGVISMDDKLILAKQEGLYFTFGNGPSANGANSDYAPAQIIPSSVGAASQASLVLTPFGVLFQSANQAGVWLLDRSLTASYIGSDVESYNNLTITSGVLYPQYNQVRFTTKSAVCLVFDYYMKQWSVYTGISANQACIFQGQWTYADSGSNKVYQESPTLFTDNGTFIQLKLATTWMQLAGLQGFQRIYEALILGDYESAHTLNANVYYDFDPTVSQITPIVPTSTPPYQWRLLFTRQKCEAIKIELYDTQNSPAEGLRLSAITLKVGVKGGLNRMPAARTFE